MTDITIIETPKRKLRKFNRNRSQNAPGTKKRKNKPVTTTKLKKEADRLFSLYIRNKYADSEGNIQCYTCPTIKHIKKMQNGHFVGRKYLGTRYEEKNCRPQCWYCNAKHMGNGRPVEFAENLKKEYGPTIVQELFDQAQPLMKNFDFQAIITKYTLSP